MNSYLSFGRLCLWLTAIAAAVIALRCLRDTVRITIEIGAPRAAATPAAPAPAIPAKLLEALPRWEPPRYGASRAHSLDGSSCMEAVGGLAQAAARASLLGVAAPRANHLVCQTLGPCALSGACARPEENLPAAAVASLGPVPVDLPGRAFPPRAQSDAGAVPTQSCPPEASFAHV